MRGPRPVLTLAIAATITFGLLTAGRAEFVLTRDGRKISGQVKSCIADRCQVGSQSVPRNTIEWIAFDVPGSPKPPAIKDPTTDEEHLRDGTIESGALIGLNLGEVVTDRTNFKRSDVAWIHLAGPVIEKPSAVGGTEVPQTQPPSPSPQPKNPPPPPPTPPSTKPKPKPTPKPQPDGGGPVKPCPADNPLGGRVVFTNEYVNNGCRGTNRYVIRFPLVHFYLTTADRPWPEQVFLGFNESQINYEVSTTGCSGVTSNGEEKCDAPGGRRAGTWIRPERQLPYIRFWPDKPSLDVTQLPAEITSGFNTPLICVGPHSSGKSSWPGNTRGFSVLEEGHPACSNDEGNVFCVPQAGRCSRPGSAEVANCVRNGDRYAVIPFHGDRTWRSPKASDSYYQGLVETHLQWDVCCGCAALPNPPEASNDPCGDTETADGLAERNRDEREAKKTSLEESWSEYKADMAAAKSHLADFQSTIARCNIQDRATKILIGTLGLFTPAGEAEIAGESAEVAEEIAEAAEELGELIGDPGVTTAEVVEKILAGEDPTASAVPNEEFQNFRKAGEEAARAEEYLRGSSVEQLEERLDQCAGTIGLSNETYRGAKDYVEKLKEGTDRLPDIQKLVNDIRNLDNDYPTLQYNAWAACVRRARCKGTPESACDSKKPPGQWPPVQ